MQLLLAAICLLAAPNDASEAVVMHLEVTPTELHLGDVVFLRITLENRGQEPVPAPLSCLLETGDLTLRLYDPEERISYHFAPEGCPMGFGRNEAPLLPGTTRVVALRALPLPRLEQFPSKFWNPQHWRAAQHWSEQCYLVAACGRFSASSERMRINPRSDQEMATLCEFLETGRRATGPPDWDISRPTLGYFGFLSLPLSCSRRETLERIQQKLSPGTFRDMVHGSLLALDISDAKALDERRQATEALLQWLDARDEIERHWIAMQLVSWPRVAKQLGEYCFELVDQLIPRLPPEYRGEDWQSKYRKENDYLRESYREFLQQSQPADRATGGDAE